MATGSERMTVALQELDSETNAAAARVDDLIKQINATEGVGLNGPQTEAVLTQLEALKTNWSNIGKNPSQPFPPLPPLVPVV